MQFTFDLLSEGEQQRFRQKLRVLEARKPRQCEHIKSNGEFCGSPALRERNYCYFHLTQIGRKLRAEHAYRESDVGPTHSNPANEWGARDSHPSNPGLGGAPTASAPDEQAAA